MSKKYVMVKAYFGLGGNIAVLLCAMRIAEQLGRELLIDWNFIPFYGNKGTDIFGHLFANDQIQYPENLTSLKVWPHFWQDRLDESRVFGKYHKYDQVSADQLPDNVDEYDVIVITRDDSSWSNPKYTKEYRRLVKKLVVNDDIRTSYQLPRNTIGIHFRHGNGEPLVVPPDINWFFLVIDKYLHQDSSCTLLVCTDCSVVVDRFRDKYKDKQVIATSKNYRPLGTGGMHRDRNRHEHIKLNAAIEALIDIYALSNCSAILATQSYFSSISIRLKDEPKYIHLCPMEHRTYELPASHVAVTNIETISNYLTSRDILTDGIHIHEQNNTYTLYYLHHRLCSFTTPEKIVISELKKRLVSTRLY